MCLSICPERSRDFMTSRGLISTRFDYISLIYIVAQLEKFTSFITLFLKRNTQFLGPYGKQMHNFCIKMVSNNPPHSLSVQLRLQF